MTLQSHWGESWFWTHLFQCIVHIQHTSNTPQWPCCRATVQTKNSQESVPGDTRISFTLAWVVGAVSSWLTHHWHSRPVGQSFLLGLFPKEVECRLHGIWGSLMKGDAGLNTVRTTSRIKTFIVRRSMWRINRNCFVCGSSLEDTLWVHQPD